MVRTLAWDIEPVRKQGKLYSYLQPLDRPFGLVATHDIGRVAAETLLQSWSGHPPHRGRRAATVFAERHHRRTLHRAWPDRGARHRFRVPSGSIPSSLRVCQRNARLSGWRCSTGSTPAGSTSRPRHQHVTGHTKLQAVLESLVAKS
jgi:hypothetical protein